ncbi:sugar ABC transporter ATP-binding protein [Rhizobium etli bv. phaseoli str. IE4803]|nr:sugar ABC transporter ATP-binding protein [Rhizobium etli bv. phaseoli str. IE4803]
MAFLEISGLRKRFGAVDILKGIDLELEKGGFLVLVGPSGCGKSTLLNTIAGLETITSGDIKIDGRDISGLHPSKRDIAMVFQSYALYPNMTVAGNIAFGMEIRGVPKEERAEGDQAGLRHAADRPPARPQAVAALRRPAPACGHGPGAGAQSAGLSVRRAAVQPRRQAARRHAHRDQAAAPAHGHDLVYVTHDHDRGDDAGDQRSPCSRTGWLQQFGTPAEIYNSPANLFVADFMGSPAMNLLTATVEAGASGIAVSLERPNGAPLRLPVVAGANGLSAYAGKQVIFGIRPEALTDPDGADRKARSLTEDDCLIEVVEPAGSDTFAVTKLGGKSVVARLRADAGIAPGQNTRLAFNLDKAVFFDPDSQVRIA